MQRTEKLDDTLLSAIEVAIGEAAHAAMSNKEVARSVRSRFYGCGVSGGVVRAVRAGMSLKEALRDTALADHAPLSWPETTRGYFVPLDETLAGPIDQFGLAFWATIKKFAPEVRLLNKELLEVRYDDPYVLSPLGVRLVHELFRGAPCWSPATTNRVRTAASKKRKKRPAAFHDDFENEESRFAVLQAVFKKAVEVFERSRELDLDRPLVLRYADGRSLLIDLGHTIGRIKTVGDIVYPGSGAVDEQIDVVRGRQFEVEVDPRGTLPRCKVIAPAPEQFLMPPA